jgi:hypothetical protein
MKYTVETVSDDASTLTNFNDDRFRHSSNIRSITVTIIEAIVLVCGHAVA